MRDGRRAKLGRGESERGLKVVTGRRDWGRMWCSILDQGTNGNEKFRDKLPAYRADG